MANLIRNVVGFSNICFRCGLEASLTKQHFYSKKNVICISPKYSSFSLRPIFSHLSHCRYYSSRRGKTTMNSWTVDQYGGIDELTLAQAARPATIKSPNEILVKVHAASVNPIDVRMLGGYGRKLINIVRTQKCVMHSGTEFPLILGRDFSGTVVETGRSVRKFKVGDEVWGALSVERPGTLAEYTVVSQKEISLKPGNVDHIEAASIPYVATTTWTALCTVGGLWEQSAPGKRILVLGGSGGVGTFVIQLAKSWAMDVTVTCSPDAIEQVTGLGADVAIDYTSSDVWRQLGQMEKFDMILDGVGGDSTHRASELLNPWKNSKLVTLVSPLLKNSDVNGVVPGLVKTVFQAGFDTLRGLKSGGSVRWAVFMPNGRALDRVRRMVEANQIKPVVQEVFPFDQVPAAFQKVSDGHLRGKIVINMADGV